MQLKWQVTHVAMAHRTGTVKVCEASVIIAVSSPHRQAALQVGSSSQVTVSPTAPAAILSPSHWCRTQQGDCPAHPEHAQHPVS